MHSAKFVVGVARLELAALRSRTVRATKLRYTPIIFCKTDSINPTAFAIYNNWRIFATKTRHLSQNLSFATLFFIYD